MRNQTYVRQPPLQMFSAPQPLVVPLHRPAVAPLPKPLTFVGLKKTKKRIRKRSEKSLDFRSGGRRKRESLEEEEDPTPQLTFSRAYRSERGSCAQRHSDLETTDSSNEASKIGAKILRVTNYWSGRSMLIPNTFRITCYIDDDEKNVLEYQDLSKKEVLAQFNSKQSGSFDLEDLPESRDRGAFRMRDAPLIRKSKSAARANFK